MKKLLIATSALVATAGVAAAQVSVSGSARFGLQYVANVPAGTTSYIVSNRVRVNFSMSGTADNGVTFGAFTRLNMQQGINVAGGASRVSGANVFLAANGFRITVGNMDNAVAHRVALYGGGLGFTGSFGVAGNFDGGGLLDNTGVGAVMVPTTHTAYSEQSNGGGGFTGVRIDADFGDFGASLGFVSLAGGAANPAGVSTTEVALSYSAGGLSAAIGGRFGNNAANGHGNQTSVSLGYRMGDIAVGAVATNIANQAGSAFAGGTNWRLWGTYTTGPWTLRATATQINSTVGGRGTGTAWGIGGSYNLGGGASASLAVGSNVSNNTVAELGVNMRF